jgi:hypothetical protein
MRVLKLPKLKHYGVNSVDSEKMMTHLAGRFSAFYEGAEVAKAIDSHNMSVKISKEQKNRIGVVFGCSHSLLNVSSVF